MAIAVPIHLRRTIHVPSAVRGLVGGAMRARGLCVRALPRLQAKRGVVHFAFAQHVEEHDEEDGASEEVEDAEDREERECSTSICKPYFTKSTSRRYLRGRVSQGLLAK